MTNKSMTSLGPLSAKAGKNRYISINSPFLFQTKLCFQAYNKELKTLLNQSRDNAVLAVDMGENPPTADSAKTAKNNSGGRKKVKLEDLTRFTMVKRIF